MSTEKYMDLLDEDEDELALRALFERRATGIPLPRSLESRVMDAVDSVSQARGERRAARASASRIAFALAACVSFFVGNGWLGSGFGSPSRSMTMAVRNGETMAMSSSMDEPLACALPVSGFVSSGSARAQACSGPEQTISSMHHVPRDPRVCEEALASIATR